MPVALHEKNLNYTFLELRLEFLLSYVDFLIVTINAIFSKPEWPAEHLNLP